MNQNGVRDKFGNDIGVQDKFGNDIHIGSYITYPYRRGSYMTMRVGRVIEVYLNPRRYLLSLLVRAYYPNSGIRKTVRIVRIDNVTEISKSISDEYIYLIGGPG